MKYIGYLLKSMINNAPHHFIIVLMVSIKLDALEIAMLQPARALG